MFTESDRVLVSECFPWLLPELWSSDDSEPLFPDWSYTDSETSHISLGLSTSGSDSSLPSLTTVHSSVDSSSDTDEDSEWGEVEEDVGSPISVAPECYYYC
jgi:hypothetical protein